MVALPRSPAEERTDIRGLRVCRMKRHYLSIMNNSFRGGEVIDNTQETPMIEAGETAPKAGPLLSVLSCRPASPEILANGLVKYICAL